MELGRKMIILTKVKDELKQSDLDGIQLFLEDKFNLTVQNIEVLK